MFRRCRPLVCSTATGVSFGAQHPTGRTACVGCTASPNRTASSSPSWLRRFSYALITVLLAVLAAKLVAQKHNASLSKPLAVSQGGWSAPHPVLLRSRRLIGDTPGLTATPREQNYHNPGRVAKVGLAPAPQ